VAGSGPAHAHAGALRVGVVSDTHGKLPDAALTALAGVDTIVHAGDVEATSGPSRFVLEQLRAIAPVVAVRGNGDTSGDAALLTDVAAGVDVVVTGHSHKAHVERVGDVLYLNPGSAGDGRGHGLSVAIVSVAPDGSAEAEIVEL
jgi:predicted phosphodiesterase